MRFTKKRRTDNYFGILSNTYETLQIGDYECQKFQTSRSLPYYMQELGWIELTGRSVTWKLSNPPTRALAVTLMEFATKRTTEYSKKAKEKIFEKKNIAIAEIKFEQKPNPIVVDEEPRYTWAEWLERLKTNPVYEYRLTRVKRSTEPEVIL
jgi:hypothetical protein